jgi:hypothetical protein
MEGMNDSGNGKMVATVSKDDGMRGNDRQPRLTVGLSGSNLVRVSDFNQRVVLQAIRVARFQGPNSPRRPASRFPP